MREPELPEKGDEGTEPPLTPEQITEMKRRARSTGAGYTSAQVQDRLRALEKEWERTGGFDIEYMRAFLARIREDDPPHYAAWARPAEREQR